MLVDGVARELRITFGAAGVPCFLERAAATRDLGHGTISRTHKIGGEIERLVDLLRADERATTARRNGVRRVGANGFERSGPIIEMRIAAVAGGVILDDVAGHHDVRIWHEGDDIAGRMRAADEHELDGALAKIDGHALLEGHGGPREAGNGLVALEEAREAAEFGVPVLLPALVDHGVAFFRGDDLARLEGRSTEHAHGVIVREHDILDRLIRDLADVLDDFAGEARGCLRVDDHDGVVADDDAGVRVALRGEGIEIAPDLGERDLLLGHVADRRECLAAHASSQCCCR